jgi:DNA polymerase-3 subunit alpha
MQKSRIKTIKYLGKQPTIDIEVDHPEHVYYANGILTSNSHAVCYAANAYISAYLKCHFPRAFYTSYLYYANNQQKPHEEIRKLVKDAKLSGIEILGPDILHLCEHFTLEGRDIRFGIADIKGIGKNAYKKLSFILKQYVKNTEKKLENISWNEFLIYISRKIGSGTNMILFQGGAMSYLGLSRTQLCFEYELFNRLTDLEQMYIAKEMTNQSIADKKLGDIIKILIEDNIPNVRRKVIVEGIIKMANNPPYNMEDSPEWLAHTEANLFGVPLICSGLENKTEDATHTCMDYIQSPTECSIALSLDEVKEHVTKNGKSKGKKMAFMTASDLTGKLECVIFPEEYAQFELYIFAGNNILAGGTPSKDKSSFIIKNVKQI